MSNTTLTSVQYQEIINITSESVDIELTRVMDSESQVLLIEQLLNIYYTQQIHSFFVLVNLTTLTEDVFTNRVLRDFVLSLTDRVSIAITACDFDYETLVNTLVVGVCRNKLNPSESSRSLINTEVITALYINPEVLKTLLKDNFWLVVVFLIILFFNHSQTYQEIHRVP